MLFRELFPIALGGTGFVGLAGTSSYFLYKHVKTNSIREEINQDLGELRDEVLKLIEEDSKFVGKLKKGKKLKNKERKEKISAINQIIKELQNKNNSRWKNYTDQVDEILGKYQEILQRTTSSNSIQEILKIPQLSF